MEISWKVKWEEIILNFEFVTRIEITHSQQQQWQQLRLKNT